MGKILGFSDYHYSLVANFRHLSTGYISHQFHLVFDDLFETVINTRYYESVFNSIYNDIFELNSYWYARYEHDDTVKLIY